MTIVFCLITRKSVQIVENRGLERVFELCGNHQLFIKLNLQVH